MRRLALYLLVPMLLLAGLSETSLAKESARRPFRFSDQFEWEQVPTSAITFAPDGRSLAFARVRPISTQPKSLVIDETRSDVWLQGAPGQSPRNLTHGASDQSGWWAPRWSPDGKYLAMLSSRGGEVGLWVWERSSNQLRQVSRQGVEFDNQAGAYRWIDNARMAYLAYPEGEQALPLAPTGAYPGRATQQAVVAWAQAARGELSASAVDSQSFRYPERDLIVVDAVSGALHTLGRTRLATFRGANWWLSPEAGAVVLIAPKPTPHSYSDASQLSNPADLELHRLDGQPLRLDRPLPSNIATDSLRFSPDGQSLAFFAWGDVPINPTLLYGEEAAKDVVGDRRGPLENPARLWQVDLAQGQVTEIDIGGLDLGRTLALPTFHWTATGELLIRAVRRPTGGAARADAPSEWLLLSRDGGLRLLTSGNASLPDDLQSIEGGKRFVGLREGEVWRIDPDNGTVTSLTEGLSAAVEDMNVVAGTGERPATLILTTLRAPKTDYEKMVQEQGRKYSSSYDATSAYYRLDADAGQTAPLPKADARAQLSAYDVSSGSAVWRTEDRRGTFLWRSSGKAAAEELLATNTYWKHVLASEERTIEYTTLNGERMQARIVLPPGYKKGRRYPLVVDFDIGYTAEGSSQFAVNDASSLPTITDEFGAGPISAAGYIYMFASWPGSSMDDIGRANLLLGVNSIIPAAEKAIELGIADPDRLFLFGSSSAGYGVYALVTQTSRFKAVAAHAGWVDQVTAPLSISINERYTPEAFSFSKLFASYTNRRLPLWRIADLLRRNSPLSYIDRVQTPLLILHGDLDGNPITQPEMFFKALVAQRKPARFVRYWGEGHGIKSPANVRDYYQQLFAWYDQWGDIARGTDGEMLWDGDRVKSRNGAPAWLVDDYDKLDLFASGGGRTHGSSRSRDAAIGSLSNAGL